ncbi:PREDICTED: DNA polymerase epsilon subunit 4 [Ceratosolen solmsi marchali]|uniref:DNA polymerase epsilon subunit 4 n=1 Tax=Ceratosolen solmsi marchali TaxID=326594 RepID=A0AAJ7DT27_9HYME|nr:PREDICTED: DNA polymerase epsilon subunit 4 [Ceratosolen solmsi marchali]
MESPTMEETCSNDSNLNNEDVSTEYNEDPDFQKEHELDEAEALQDEEPKIKLTKLPIGRIRTIVKTDPDINFINQEAIFLITKATELFIDSLAKESYKYTYQSKKKTLQKHDVQSAIDNVDALMFLDGI